jgi:hypothetical protein
MQSFQKHLLFWVVLFTGGLAQAETYREIDFSCKAIPQANLNGVTLASEVRTAVKNLSGEKLVARYHVVVTSTQGRVEELGQPAIRGNLGPHAIENNQFTPFSKVSVQDEFPKTCQFTQIQVCPATPPADFPKGVYFRTVPRWWQGM